MKTLARPLLAAALACALVACRIPDTTMENGAIMLYGSVVTLHVDGAPKADIAADGTFDIDGKAVAITPAERDLLAQYNRSVRSVHQSGVAMGKAGIETAANALADKVSPAPAKAGTAAEAALQDPSLDICKDTAAIKAVQDRLATQLAAFRPYASIVGASDASDCTTGGKG